MRIRELDLIIFMGLFQLEIFHDSKISNHLRKFRLLGTEVIFKILNNEILSHICL